MTDQPAPDPKPKFDKVKFLRKALLYFAFEICLIGFCICVWVEHGAPTGFGLFFIVNSAIILIHLANLNGSSGGDEGIGCM